MSKRVVPMIHVPDVRATVDWYKDIGFEVVETYGRDGPGLSFAVMSFGATQVMFNQGGRTSTERRREVDLYVYTEDVDGVYQQLKHRVDIVEGLHDTFYGMREFISRDLNRFWIIFGQPSVYGMLLGAIRAGKPDLVQAALSRKALKPQSLTNALVEAKESATLNAYILDLLEQAGAVAPPEIDDQILEAHSGTYRSDAGMEVEIRLKDHRLFAVLSAEEQIRLLPINRTTFRPLIFDGVTVRFDVEGAATRGFMLQDHESTTQFLRVAESK